MPPECKTPPRPVAEALSEFVTPENLIRSDNAWKLLGGGTMRPFVPLPRGPACIVPGILFTVTTVPENLLNLSPAEADARLRAFAAESGQPSYRATQVLRRLWVNPAASFADMTDLPAELRQQLAARFTLPRLEVVARQQSRDGTQKFLFRLHDGQTIETVAIPADINVIAEYPVAVVADATQPKLAAAWIALLLSPAGQRGLAQAGFMAPMRGERTP